MEGLGPTGPMKSNREFWSQQRVLLTGHTGFKGTWLSLWLERLGAITFGVALEPVTDPSVFKLTAPHSGLASRIGDIRDLFTVAKAVSEARPTIVIHMAAQALVRLSYRVPAQTFETNVMGTINLLEALRSQNELRAALVVTTDKVYQNLNDHRALREHDPLGAHDPYSASKAAAEIAVSSWSQSFFEDLGIPVVTARAGNVIGGGDWSEDRLVPDILRAILKHEQVMLRYPGATRPWQHVLDPLAGYLRYVEAVVTDASVPKALNFGPRPDDALTVAELAETMLTAAGAPSGWRQDPGPFPSEKHDLALDATLAGETIGWRPRMSSGDAVRWTAEWHSRLAGGESARSLCLEQISRYESLP